jgi:hypothetical protein
MSSFTWCFAMDQRKRWHYDEYETDQRCRVRNSARRRPNEAETEIRAQAVRFVPERDGIEIVTNRNAGFLIPRQWIGALPDVPTEELSKPEIWPEGSAIELEDRDVHISVHGLLTAFLPAMLPSRTVAAIFASRGGQATSRAATQLKSERSQRRPTSQEGNG